MASKFGTVTASSQFTAFLKNIMHLSMLIPGGAGNGWGFNREFYPHRWAFVKDFLPDFLPRFSGFNSNLLSKHQFRIFKRS